MSVRGVSAPSKGYLGKTLSGRNRVCLIGDSITSNGTATQGLPTSAGSFVVSNGVATLNFGTTTKIFVGNYFFLVNPGDAAMASPDNGRLILALSGSSGTATSNTATFATTLANGDYSNLYGNSWSVYTLDGNSDSGYFHVLNNFFRGQFLVSAIYSGSGLTSSQMLAMLPKIQAGVAFDIAFLMGGTNDIDRATSPALAYSAVDGASGALANMTALAQALIALGARVFICCPPANSVGTTGTNTSATKNIALAYYRNLIYKYAYANQSPGQPLQIFDMFRETIAGQSASGGYISNATLDNLHPSSSILWTMARNQNANIFGIQPLDQMPVTVLDDSITYAQVGVGFPNTLQNAGMAGTGGTLSGGATGSVANNWALALQGGATSVVGTGNFTPTAIGTTNSANWGFAQRVQCSTSATGQGFQLNSGSNPSAITTGWYRAGIRIYVRSNTSGFGSLVGTFTTGIAHLFNATGSASNGYSWLSGDVIELTTGPLWLSSAVQDELVFIYTSNAAGSVDLEFSAGFVRQIDNPYG